MKTYKIGRSKQRADIVLPNMGTDISGVHIELVDMENGQYYINDLSSNGTYILESKQWVKTKQTYVTMQTQLRLGSNYPINIGDILQYIASKTAVKPQKKAAPSKNEGIYTGKIERNPETGEIIRH